MKILIFIIIFDHINECELSRNLNHIYTPYAHDVGDIGKTIISL